MFFCHAFGAVDGAPAEAELHGFVAFVLVFLGFGAELGDGHGVEAAGVDGDFFLGAAAEEAEDGLLGGFAEEVPEGDVDGGDGDHGDALAAEGHGAAVHLLPEELDVPGVGAEEDGREVGVDEGLGDLGREGGVAEADEAGVGEDFDEHPAVEGEVAHGGLAEGDEVHGVGAEVRGEGDGGAGPFDDAGADFGDLHAAAGSFAGLGF